MKTKQGKDRVFKLVVILILLFILYSLIQINLKVREHYEAFDENPLLFGAKKYDINQCTCTNSKGASFLFNQEKLWREKKTGEVNYTFEVNFSKLIN